MTEARGTADRIPNFFEWWFVDQPAFYWDLSKKMGYKMLQYFSITLLLKTLFAPWKRDIKPTSKMPLDMVFRTLIENFISRGIGFIIRAFAISIGLASTILIFFFCIFLMLFWILLPVLIIYIVFRGSII